MQKRSSIYNRFHIVTAIFLVLSLVWLTVSLPFVYEGQQYAKMMQCDNSDDDNASNNTTEEKSPNTIQEEFLHENDDHDFAIKSTSGSHGMHNYSVYIAFHGELIAPPPDL